jgi:hypothetical protein
VCKEQVLGGGREVAEDALQLPLPIFIDVLNGHGSIGDKHGYHFPLADCFGHWMFGQ